MRVARSASTAYWPSIFRARGALASIMLASYGAGASGAPSIGSPPVVTPSHMPAPTPTPAPNGIALAKAMAPGWNLGNSLEAIGSGAQPATSSQETAWGNPPVTQELLNAVKSAGFNSVRIPVAWSQYTDAAGNISPAWMARVTDVVTYARNAGLYVIINIHWDGGWMQPTYAEQGAVNAKLTRLWAQIANNFKGQDGHLLFAGTNEVMVTNLYAAPTAEHCAVQNSFNQTFVNAVRATGGNNATRYLVVQTFNTGIDYGMGCNLTLPSESAANRLMIEVHYYDPYNFALNEKSKVWQWGSIAAEPNATETSASEAHADAQFDKMKVNFIDKGIPVILGEYSAIGRTEYDPAGMYRTYWDKYITLSAYRRGLVPMYWDNGYISNHATGLFDRTKAKIAFPDTVKAIIEAAR
ncbi:MAG: glycoside hydrolase family 5 protein [Sphingomonas sp.]